MADGKNEARTLRIAEIMNDFRTTEVQIRSQTSRTEASPPDQASTKLEGYLLLKRCQAESQELLSSPFNPGNSDLGSRNNPSADDQKAKLQSIMLDASTRRFRAYKIYLRAAAATRWVMLRRQLMARPGAHDSNREQAAIEQRLRQEIVAITDSVVYNDLRATDQRKAVWQDEDPSLERILAWIKTQRGSPN